MTMTLPDARARERIAHALDTNLVVEAAAGTGKTTAMVERIVNLMRNGRRRFAAVTFTHKAAAELRQRLEARLARAFAGDEHADERAQAAAALADCHIGTIHSFCARLLRERPVEAGLSPDFRELDDSEDATLRAQAWNEFARQLSAGEHKGLYEVFATFGLDLDTLGQGFCAFADYPDIDEWIGADAGMHQIDAQAFVDGTRKYYETLAPFAAALENADAGTDTLMPICQILRRRFPRLKPPLSLADACRLAAIFKNAPKITQKSWTPLGLDKDAVTEFANAYQRFFDETVAPFRDACLAAAYAAAIEAYTIARGIHDALRLESGLVNFQDLLLTTARMLREHPSVRADFAEQYERLLIDEVQDTDPVQAEIMFLLAGANPRERDWRRCAPRPGALFIVGDPKQSIYRFRRADITVYQEIKTLIRQHGGEVLGLTANFRSQPEILEWVNNTFSSEQPAPGRFTREETPYSPAYIPLEPGLAATENTGENTPAFHGVHRLEAVPVSKKDGITEQDVFRDEAARIARFIRHAVDTRLPLPGRNGTRPAQPGDFLVITYEKSKAALYANAVRALGLACRLSSGGTLGGSESLRLLAGYLAAIDNPDDPIALTAVLRGELFGISDPELYAWKKSGGEFSFLFAKEATPENTGIAPIFAQMRTHAALLKANAPAAVLGTIADDLGLWAYAATGDDPSTQTGALATALELLKRESPPTLARLAERLAQLRDTYDKDPLPATEPDANAVRVMNLHKTKGLEAPVVFLTCTRGMRPHSATLAVRRGEKNIKAALALHGGRHGTTLLARPLHWDKLAEEEEQFLAAEKTRLHYVAATRAGAALIVTVHSGGTAWKTAFLPQYVHGETIPQILPEPDPAAAPKTLCGTAENPDLAALDETIRRSETSRAALTAHTYAVERAKQESAAAPAASRKREETIVPPEHAAAYGEVLHRALAGADASDLLEEFELPKELQKTIEETVQKVRASAIWKRAKASEEMYQEAPFTLYEEPETEGELPKLTRGVIDLVFKEKEKNGWTIVDFKSDAVTQDTIPAAAAQHRPQLRAYARAWSRLTGEKVTETALYFLHADAYFPITTEEQTALF